MNFPSNSKQDPPFHCIAYYYSRAVWDGLPNYLKDVPLVMSLNSVHLLLVMNFVSWFRLVL